jgi:hypothetical protein
MCIAYAAMAFTGTITASSVDSDRVLRRVSTALGFSSTGKLVEFNDSPLTTFPKMLQRLKDGINATADPTRTYRIPTSIPGPGAG